MTKGSIYVGNLPRTFTGDELRQVFESAGSIESVVVKEGKTKDGSQQFSYGFVNFSDESSVDVAIAAGSGKVLQGRILTVRRSEKSKNQKTTPRPYQTQNGENSSVSGSKGTDDGKVLQGYEEFVTITHLVDPHTLFVQAINQDTLEKFAVIVSKLQDHCNQAQPLSGAVPGKQEFYGAIFAEDGAWYRCQVKNYNSNKAEVIYIDYGNSAEVEMSAMVPLSEELKGISPLAQQIRIIGVAPQLRNASSNAAKEAFKYLGSLDEDGGASKKLKVVIAGGVDLLDDGSLPVQLFYSDANVAETLNRKFAPDFQEKVQHAVATAASGGGGSGNHPLLGGKHRPHREIQAAGDSGSAGRGEPRQAQSNAELLAKIEHLERELEQMRGRLDPKSHRSHENASKVKNLEDIIEQLREEKMDLQTQMLSLKSQMQEGKDRNAKKLGAALQTRLAPLAESFHRVNEARRCFIIDADHKSTIQLAIELANKRLHPFVEGSPSRAKGDLISLIPDSAPVGARLQELEALQQTIQNLESKDDLPKVMLERNDARHEAYKALTTFLDDVKKLPIAVRLSDIEMMMDQLQTEYGSYLDPTKVMQSEESRADVECFEEYQYWLAERCEEITPLRAVTDELRGKWCDLLKNLLESFQYGALSVPNLDCIDELRDQLLVAMETEVTFTLEGYVPSIELHNRAILQIKQEQDVREVEIVSSTVRALVSALAGEKQTLASLVQLCENFSLTAAQLHPWLNGRPDVAPLQAVMREVKTLRSRLRHKLADCHDLEEDPDLADEVALSELKQEVRTIQKKLWGCYLEESDLLREIADLTSNHFPELPFTYPTFGITKYLETNGLVREGRDLKHFDLSQIEGCQKTTVKLASVNGTPVSVIKIIHLPEKTTLEKMVAYSVIEVPHCMDLGAVYQAPDGSQLFLQLPYMNMGNLETALATEGALTKVDVLGVCRDVLEALVGLHRLGLVHGGVHPRNVLLHRREGVGSEEPTIIAKLAEFDFTKTTNETALKGYTASNQLKFTAPEVNCGLQAASQADIFSAGILLLWALYPTAEFKMEVDGIPDLSGCSLPPSLVALLEEMLSYSPMKRPAAARVLKAPFFLDPPCFAEEEEEKEEEEEEASGGRTEVNGDGGDGGEGQGRDEGAQEEEGKEEEEQCEGEDEGSRQEEQAAVNSGSMDAAEQAEGNGEEEVIEGPDEAPKDAPAAAVVPEGQAEPGKEAQPQTLVVQEPAAAEDSVQTPGSSELTVSQGSPAKDADGVNEEAEDHSDCDSEPPPLEDDEAHEDSKAPAEGTVSEESVKTRAEIDDNSSPV